MGKFFKGLLVAGAAIFAFMKWGGLIVGIIGAIVSAVIYFFFVSGGDS